MAVPKKKTTKRRRDNRRSQGHGKLIKVKLAKCTNCSHLVMPHRVCPNCGFYKGQQIVVKMAS